MIMKGFNYLIAERKTWIPSQASCGPKSDHWLEDVLTTCFSFICSHLVFITAYGQFKLPREFEMCLSLATLSWFGLRFVCTSPDLLAGGPVFALTLFAAQNWSTRGPSCFSGQVVSATEVHRKPSAGNSSSTSLTVDGRMTVSRAETTQTGTGWKYGNSKFEKKTKKKHLNSCGSLASLLVVMFSSRNSY